MYFTRAVKGSWRTQRSLETVLLLALWETFSGAPMISFQPSWSWASMASCLPLASSLGPVTLRTHSLHSLWFHPRLLSGQSGFSLGKNLIKYVFTSNSPSCPATTVLRVLLLDMLLVLLLFLTRLTICPAPSSDHLLLVPESNTDPFPIFKLWNLALEKKNYLKIKTNNHNSICHCPSNC